MNLSLFKCSKVRVSLYVILLNMFACQANSSPTVLMSAMISGKGAGCEMILPQTVIDFRPLQANKLKGDIQAYEIKPLAIRLSCLNETQAIKPRLTLQGITPYDKDTSQTVFVDGDPNGMGFMIRQSLNNEPFSLIDFYKPESAISNNGQGILLDELNDSNQHKNEGLLWIGLVGPFQNNIKAGRFQASLIVNVMFE